jgi:organic hydroperoxide reductase OsmC/OhrA
MWKRRSEMSTLKDFRFQVEATPLRGRRVRLSSDGKTPIKAATPPEFRDGTPGLWSPEDLLVASVASCYLLTLDALATRRELSFEAHVEGAGHVTLRADGRLGFVVIELQVSLTVEPGLEQEAERLARDAERRCLISHALEVPVELELSVRTAVPVPVPEASAR